MSIDKLFSIEGNNSECSICKKKFGHFLIRYDKAGNKFVTCNDCVEKHNILELGDFKSISSFNDEELIPKVKCTVCGEIKRIGNYRKLEDSEIFVTCFDCELELNNLATLKIEDIIKESRCSTKTNEWRNFAFIVNNHIENYVIPQYGDKYEDPMSNWTVEQIAGQAEKYLKRIGKNSRDGQDKLDMLKLAHCSQMIYDKIKEAKNEDRT